MIYGTETYGSRRYEASIKKFRSLTRAREWAKSKTSPGTFRCIWQMPFGWRPPSEKWLLKRRGNDYGESLTSVLVTLIMRTGKELSPLTDDELTVHEVMDR